MDNGVNRGSVIAVAAMLTAVGALVPNTMPVLLGVFADSRGYDSRQLGFLASSFMGGLWLMTVALMFSIRRIDWRAATGVCCLTLLVGLALAAQIGGFRALMGLFFLSGLGAGGAFGVGMTSLADTRQPDRNLGLATLAQVGVAALVTYAMAALVAARWGSVGVVLTLVLFAGIGVGLSFFMEHRGARTASHAGGGRAPGALAAIAGLVGIVLLYLGIFGIWTFMERIGTQAGLSPHYVGAVISGALVSGAVGTLVPVALGDRFGRRAPILLAALMLMAAILALGSSAGRLGFALAALSFNFAWTISMIYQCGAVAAADTSGRYAAGIPQALALGAFFGPALAGAMKAQLGLLGLSAVGVLAVLASLSIAMWVAGEADRRS